MPPNKRSQKLLRPTDDNICDVQRSHIFMFVNWLRHAGIACVHCIRSEPYSTANRDRNRDTMFFKHRQEKSHVVYIREINVTREHDGLDGFFRGLLSFEAQVFSGRHRECGFSPSRGCFWRGLTTLADHRAEIVQVASYTTIPSCKAGLMTKAWLSLYRSRSAGETNIASTATRTP